MPTSGEDTDGYLSLINIRLPFVKLKRIQELTPTPDRSVAEMLSRSAHDTEASEKERAVSLPEGLHPKQLVYRSPNMEAAVPRRGIKRKHVMPSVDELCAPQNTALSDSASDSDSSSECGSAVAPPGTLSLYEFKRLKNIRQNQEFLSSMNIKETTAALKNKPARPPVKKVIPNSPQRKSMRLRGLDTVGNSLPEMPVKIPMSPTPPPGPIPMQPVNLEEGSSLPAELVELWNERIARDRKQKLDLKQYKSVLSSMSLTETRVVKVVKERVVSMAIHPCTSRLLTAVGDKWGQVGLWAQHRDPDEGVLQFLPHSRAACCLDFSTSNPAHLLSVSYDGTMRAADINKAVFDEVYRTEKSLSSFDFLSENCATLVVGYWEGDVVLVDRRTPGTSHKSRSTLHSKTVRTVHMHPVNRQYFVAAGKGNVYIYDVRRLKPKGTEAVCSLPGHRSSVTSAYFSPSSGHRVVTTCSDHMIRVFDTSTCKGEAPLLNSIKHMNTGHWLTKLCAVWDPQQEDCFVVGSMERPRRMVVFHESGQMVHNFWDEQWLGSVCSVAAFHPSRNILVGANSSGRLHVFMN